MRDYLEEKIISAKCRAMQTKWKMEDYIKGFLWNEDGDTNFISIIIIAVIIIAIAAVFQDRLKKLVGNVFDKLTNFVDNNQ